MRISVLGVPVLCAILASCAAPLPSQPATVAPLPSGHPNAFFDLIKVTVACYQRQILKYSGVPDAASDIADAVMVSCRTERTQVHYEAQMKVLRLGASGPRVDQIPADFDRDDRQTVISWVVQSRVKRAPDAAPSPSASRPGTKI